MSKTVKEHFDECQQVSVVIDNANALLTKTRDELIVARSALEDLRKYQHPEMRMDCPYRLRTQRDEGKTTPAIVIDRAVRRINELLGDRA
ncbi:hypothetical protein [Tritonibacter mobilis]|uniref:hypothetical protein n=1 Tax=Tritonibacter mobilis TaxID=379347 RepID=UPI000806A41B|nr:hypothetical protein [Tritonibacter mobilis]